MIAVEELGIGSDEASPPDHANALLPLLSSARRACYVPRMQKKN
jgi:hypothetical protein